MARIGIIGGSGLYSLEGITKLKKIEVKTPFGAASAPFMIGALHGKEIVFLPRHGRGHVCSPSEINYRANIYGMKKLKVERIISVSACGSLKEEFKPMDFVVVDQFVDRTTQAREMTFFSDGIVAHVGFAHPVCKELSGLVFEAARKTNVTVYPKGTYLNMEGPAFSTLAESNLYRSWGMDIIGMTNIAEARLCREAEICYSSLAAITDYDCWHPSHGEVTTEMVIANLTKNIANARRIISEAIRITPETRTCSCVHALQSSIVTDPGCMSQALKKKLKLIIGAYVK